MYQPGNYQMGHRLPSTRSSPDTSTVTSIIVDPIRPTETVQIQVTDKVDIEDTERTLKRGLEARQVSGHLERCMKGAKFLQISMMALGGVHNTSACLYELLVCPFNIGAIGTGLIIGSSTSLVRGTDRRCIRVEDLRN
jgi:hypothetical protein